MTTRQDGDWRLSITGRSLTKKVPDNRLSNALLPVLNKKPRDTSQLGNTVSRQSHSIGTSDTDNLAMPQRIVQQSNPCRPDPHAVIPSRRPRPEK